MAHEPGRSLLLKHVGSRLGQVRVVGFGAGGAFPFPCRMAGIQFGLYLLVGLELVAARRRVGVIPFGQHGPAPLSRGLDGTGLPQAPAARGIEVAAAEDGEQLSGSPRHGPGAKPVRKALRKTGLAAS